MRQEPYNPPELVKHPVLRPRPASVPGFIVLVLVMALLFRHLGARVLSGRCDRYSCSSSQSARCSGSGPPRR